MCNPVRPFPLPAAHPANIRSKVALRAQHPDYSKPLRFALPDTSPWLAQSRKQGRLSTGTMIPKTSPVGEDGPAEGGVGGVTHRGH